MSYSRRSSIRRRVSSCIESGVVAPFWGVREVRCSSVKRLQPLCGKCRNYYITWSHQNIDFGLCLPKRKMWENVSTMENRHKETKVLYMYFTKNDHISFGSIIVVHVHPERGACVPYGWNETAISAIRYTCAFSRSFCTMYFRGKCAHFGIHYFGFLMSILHGFDFRQRFRSRDIVIPTFSAQGLASLDGRKSYFYLRPLNPTTPQNGATFCTSYHRRYVSL